MLMWTLERGQRVPSVVYRGYVMALGRDDNEVIILCDGATYAEAQRFQEGFCRKTDLKLRGDLLTVAKYDQMLIDKGEVVA